MSKEDIITIRFVCEKCNNPVVETVDLSEVPDMLDYLFVECKNKGCGVARAYNSRTRRLEDIPTA